MPQLTSCSLARLLLRLVLSCLKRRIYHFAFYHAEDCFIVGGVETAPISIFFSDYRVDELGLRGVSRFFVICFGRFGHLRCRWHIWWSWPRSRPWSPDLCSCFCCSLCIECGLLKIRVKSYPLLRNSTQSDLSQRYVPKILRSKREVDFDLHVHC